MGPAHQGVPLIVRYVSRSPRAIVASAKLVAAIRNWPVALLDHAGLATGSYVSALRNGLSIEVRAGTDDRHIVYEIFAEGIYPIPAVANTVVLDVGAHIGCFTLVALRSGARVFSYEPFLPNSALLQRNLQRNRVAASRVSCSAVGGRRGVRTLHVPDDPSFSGRSSLHSGRGSRTVVVECVTLDDILAENRLDQVDLLKLDCQGSEYEILYSVSAGTLGKTAAIVVECEYFDGRRGWTPADMREFLRGQGYLVTSRGNLLYAVRPSASGDLLQARASDGGVWVWTAGDRR